MERCLDSYHDAKIEHADGALWLTCIGANGRKQIEGPFGTEAEAVECLLAELVEQADNDLPDADLCVRRVLELCRQHYPRYGKYRREAKSWKADAMTPPPGFDEWFQQHPGEMPPPESEA